MDYKALITRICDDGVAELRTYPDDKANKRAGGIKGFEEVRDTTNPVELAALLTRAQEMTASYKAFTEIDSVGVDDVLMQAHSAEGGPDAYWFWRYRELQIEWAANVVSAALQEMGLPTIITPTARGYNKAAEILGVSVGA